MKGSDWQRFDEDRNRGMFIDAYLARGNSPQTALAEWAKLQDRVAAELRWQNIGIAAILLAFGVIALIVLQFLA